MFFKNSNPGLPHNHAGSWVCSLNHPLTARWLKLQNHVEAKYVADVVWTTPSPKGVWQSYKTLTTSEILQSVRIYTNEHGAKVGISNGKLVVSKNGVKLKSLPAEQFEWKLLFPWSGENNINAILSRE